MSKVTSKLQVTIPKTIASKFGIRPGDEIDWVVTGEILRVVAVRTKKQPLEVKRKLQRFDEGTLRQRRRESVKRPSVRSTSSHVASALKSFVPMK